jgi:MSHA biogenesis protein MshL
MSGGSSGGSSGGGSSGGGMTAEFTVSGKTKSEKAKDFIKGIKEVAGPGSVVSLNSATGILSRSSNGKGLARTTQFVNSYTESANQRVEIHTAILEVSLNNSTNTSINWSQIVNIAGNAALSLNGIGGAENAVTGIGAMYGPQGALPGQYYTPQNGTAGGSGPVYVPNTPNNNNQLSYTSGNISSVVQALRTVGNVRIISQPMIVAENDTPATIFSGTQEPYIGSIQSNVSGGSYATTSTGASLSYVLNGLSLSFVPNVLSNNLVDIKILPSISDVSQFENFTINGNQLSGPVQELRQTYLQTLMPNNKTLIIAGSLKKSSSNNTSGTPLLSQVPVLGYLFKGVSVAGVESQLIILVRAHILPAPRFNPLIGESL